MVALQGKLCVEAGNIAMLVKPERNCVISWENLWMKCWVV